MEDKGKANEDFIVHIFIFFSFVLFILKKKKFYLYKFYFIQIAMS